MLAERNFYHIYQIKHLTYSRREKNALYCKNRKFSGNTDKKLHLSDSPIEQTEATVPQMQAILKLILPKN